MRHIEKRVKPAEEHEVFTHLTCDLCGASSPSRDNWAAESNCELLTTIELKDSHGYIEGGSATTTTVDICPTCFKERVLAWLRSQGVEPRVTEVDW